MRAVYKDALAEVDMILNYVDEESFSKIPEAYISFIKDNKSDYIAKINPKKSLIEQKLLYETKVVLSVLYRDFWSSEEERKDLIKKEQEELKNIEKNKKIKYNSEELFKEKRKNTYQIQNNSKNNSKNNSQKNTQVLVVRENFFEKILNKIKKLFKLGSN